MKKLELCKIVHINYQKPKQYFQNLRTVRNFHPTTVKVTLSLCIR